MWRVSLSSRSRNTSVVGHRPRWGSTERVKLFSEGKFTLALNKTQELQRHGNQRFVLCVSANPLDMSSADMENAGARQQLAVQPLRDYTCLLTCELPRRINLMNVNVLGAAWSHSCPRWRGCYITLTPSSNTQERTGTHTATQAAQTDGRRSLQYSVASQNGI